MNFKKMILLTVTISCVMVFTISYVQAQTSSSVISNATSSSSTTVSFGFSNATTKQATTNSTSSHVFIRPDGGYLTVPTITDENGNHLDIHIESGITQFPKGPNVPACNPNPTQGLYQEGSNWYIGSDSLKIGGYEDWIFPTGSLITNSSNSLGIYYNPVNFFIPAAGQNYTFFQVDYAMGNNLSDGTGWKMTFSYLLPNNTRLYPYINMTAISAVPGATYHVKAMIEGSDMANPPQYVVQVIQGTTTWIYYKNLLTNYNPTIGSVYGFSSFNDEYIQSSGSATNYLSDTNKNPALMDDVSSSLITNPNAVIGLGSFDNLNPLFQGTTRNIMSPSPFLCYPVGNWIVNLSCTLSSNANASSNVIVQNNSVLTIPSGTNLKINFAQNYLKINPGSGVLVNPTAKISNDNAMRTNSLPYNDLQQCSSWNN